MASDGFMFLAFEVCWSRGHDGIIYSDDLRRHHRSLVSTLAGMYFSNGVWINNCIVHYEDVVSDVR